MLSGKNVLVVAPHADDELLGCGGLLLKLREQSQDVNIHMLLVACSDVVSRGNVDIAADVRDKEFREVCNRLHSTYLNLFFQDRYLSRNVADIIKGIETAIDTNGSEIVLFPGPSYHQDHRTVNEAVYAALRPGRCPSVSTVLEYETANYSWSRDDEKFWPNVYVELDPNTLGQKLELAKIYRSQGLDTAIGQAEIKRLALRRGAEMESRLSAIFIEKYAEAFKLVRHVARM